MAPPQKVILKPGETVIIEVEVDDNRYLYQFKAEDEGVVVDAVSIQPEDVEPVLGGWLFFYSSHPDFTD